MHFQKNPITTGHNYTKGRHQVIASNKQMECILPMKRQGRVKASKNGNDTWTNIGVTQAPRSHGD